jgi:hypothetical protein
MGLSPQHRTHHCCGTPRRVVARGGLHVAAIVPNATAHVRRIGHETADITLRIVGTARVSVIADPAADVVPHVRVSAADIGCIMPVAAKVGRLAGVLRKAFVARVLLRAAAVSRGLLAGRRAVVGVGLVRAANVCLILRATAQIAWGRAVRVAHILVVAHAAADIARGRAVRVAHILVIVKAATDIVG